MSDRIPYWKREENLRPEHVAELKRRGHEIVGSLIYVYPDHVGILTRKGGEHVLSMIDTSGKLGVTGRGSANGPRGKYTWIRMLIEQGIQPE